MDETVTRNERSKLVVSMAVALFVCIVAIMFLSWSLYRSTRERDDAKALEAAARRFATELTTYDHASVKKDIDQVLDLSTGSFQKEYSDVLGGKAFSEALVAAKGRSEGEIVSIHVTDLAEDRGEVIVTLDQTVTNQNDTQPKTERRRLEVTMVKTKAGWKADRVAVI